MVRPSRRERALHNIISQHRKKAKEIKEEQKEKDPEAVENIKRLWLESQKKNKS